MKNVKKIIMNYDELEFTLQPKESWDQSSNRQQNPFTNLIWALVLRTYHNDICMLDTI